MKNKINEANLKRVRLLVIDVDGVLSDGKIIYDSQGNDYKIFHVHDGYGIRLALQAGIKVAFVSGRHSSIVDKRARDLGVEIVYQNVEDKVKVLKDILRKYRIKSNETCAIGDDIIDLPLLKEVGVPIAVSNAIAGLRKIASYVTKLPGGGGAVREVVDLILKAKKKRIKQ